MQRPDSSMSNSSLKIGSKNNSFVSKVRHSIKEEEEEPSNLTKTVAATRSTAPLREEAPADELDDDISDTSSSVAELSEKSKAFQMVLDMVCLSSMDPVLIITEKGIMKSCNQPCLELYGYKRWEIIGKNIKMMMPRRFSINHDRYLARYFKTKMKRIIGEYRDDIIGYSSKGEEFPVILKVQEIVDPDSGTSFLGVMKNMKAEKELEKMRVLLANVIPREITNQLADERSLSLEKLATVAVIQLKGFKNFMTKVSAGDGINMLADILDFIDKHCDEMDIERVKNYGDTVLVYCAEEGKYDHAVRVLELIQQTALYISSLRATLGASSNIELRAGVSYGNITIGVVQSIKMSFDVYGEAMDNAERFLKYTTSKNGTLVAQKVYQAANFKFEFENGVFEIPASEEDKSAKIQAYSLKIKL